MKTKTLQKIFMALVMGLALSFASTARADSSVIWESISSYHPAKAADAKKLKAGDTVAKVCNACKAVTIKRIVSVNQGQVQLANEKCEYCGSTDTYMAIMSDKTKAPAK